MRAHLAELLRCFQAARQPPLYGRDLVWPPPPAVLQPFQDTCHVLFSRYMPGAAPSLLPTHPAPTERGDPVIGVLGAVYRQERPFITGGAGGLCTLASCPCPPGGGSAPPAPAPSGGNTGLSECPHRRSAGRGDRPRLTGCAGNGV